MKIIVVSDLHLGNGGGYDIFAGADALPAMLATERPDRLIINGDGVDFLLDDAPIEGLDVDRAVRQAEAIVAHSKPLLAAIGTVPEVIIRLGNHDVELALPQVQAVFQEAIGENVSFVLGDDTTPLIDLNGVKILVTHGEHIDANNRLQYQRLHRAPERFRYPFGSHVVKEGLNPFKRDQQARFADLIKPDVRGGALTTALIYPGEAGRALRKAFPKLTFEFLRSRATSGRTFADADDDGVETPEWQAQMLRWLAARCGERFFSLEPTEGEKNEVDRLIAKFGCHAVIMGHSHAARFQGGRQPYINTGTWIPLVRMPGEGDNAAAWTRFISDLKADPTLTGAASRYLMTRFTAAVVTETDRGVKLDLLEWKDGKGEVLRTTQIQRMSAPFVHTAPSPGLCFPFLADETGAAFSARGAVPPEDATLAKAIVKPTTRDLSFSAEDEEPNRFWTIVVAASQQTEIMQALAPLIALRERQMHASMIPLCYPELAPRATARWVESTWSALNEEDQPTQILIAGDLDAVPMQVHRALAAKAQVGRIAFTLPDGTPDQDGYRAYAEKVVRYHAERVERRPDVLLYQVDDGTEATWLARQQLIVPAAAHLGSGRRFATVRHLPSSGFGEPTPDELLGAEGINNANILLTASHGVAPRDPEQRRALQGAMSFGREHLRAETVATRTFLPGGLWIYIACFGAGTPSQSAFAPWLKRLFPHESEAERVKAMLSARPFIAALPQAVLRNPEGPQAMIAHLDLAWSYGLTENVIRHTQVPPHRRMSDMISKLRMHRPTSDPKSFGEAHAKLRAMVNQFDQANAEARTYNDSVARDEAWMARNDLEGYVLLGDPAARLPVGRALPSPAGTQ